MARFTEPTLNQLSVKKEIKDEEFDDFLQEYLSTNIKEGYTGLEHNSKKETCASPIYKDSSPMEIKEEESELKVYGADGPSHTGDTQRIQTNKRGITEENQNMEEYPKGSKYRKKQKSPQPCDTTGKRRKSSPCPKTFPTPVALDIDLQQHAGEKPNQCFQCGKTFIYLNSLRKHQRIHTGEKPYKCSECGKAFSQTDNLKKHQRIHTGEKPFQCFECGMTFNQKTSLVKHHRIHTGEKPYKCSECGIAFSLKNNLKRHQQVHTGEKPHHCTICGKSFRKRSDVISHERIHSGEKPYHCTECGMAFAQSATLRRHTMRIHK